jgi:hypothetical protein
MRRVLAVSLVVLAFGGVSVGTAAASTWEVTQVGAGQVRSAFYGVSCPTAQLCVAVGGNNTVAATTNPTGGSSAWTAGHPGGAVDPSFGPPGGEAIYPGGQIRGVSCPSTGLCVAVSFQGNFYSSTEPAGDPSGWKVVEQGTGPNIHMTGVSCPTVSLCVAVGYAGKILTTTNPTGDAADWAVTTLPQQVDFRAVSCASASLCVATGNEGTIVASTDPLGGPTAWRSAGAPGGDAGLDGISCPTLSLCVTGNPGRVVSSTDPAGPAASWRVVSAGTGLPVTGFSCPSIHACAAVDTNADVMISTDPTGGSGAWSFKNVIPFDTTPGAGAKGNGMFGISCATTSFCAAVGQSFQVLTSTDPFARERANQPGKRRSKRPRTVITAHPAKRLDPKKGGVKVRFRFRAIGKAARFQCKLDDRRFRKCKSPRRYRVAGGLHVFKVRAVTASGLRGPRATFHFRVGKLTEPPSPGSCKPGQGSTIGKPCLGSG